MPAANWTHCGKKQREELLCIYVGGKKNSFPWMIIPLLRHCPHKPLFSEWSASYAWFVKRKKKKLPDQVEGTARFQTNLYHFRFIFSQVCQTSLVSDICKVDGKMKRERWQESAQLKINSWCRSCKAQTHTDICRLRWRKKSRCVNTDEEQLIFSER